MRLVLAAAGLLLGAPAAAEPLELFNGRLFVEATLNGEPVRALLDSGAEMTVLDDDYAAARGLAAEGSATGRGSGAETFEARFVRGATIAAAGVTLADRTVAVFDLDEVARRLVGRDLDMVLGRDLFDAARLRIDIEGGTIAVCADEPRGARLPVTDRRGIPTVPVSIEGEPPVQADFDLGNGSGVMVGRAYAARLGLTAPERIVGRASGGGLGGAVERDRVVLRSLVVAGREYRDVPAAIDPAEDAVDLNIGTSILRDFVITTDFAEGAVWLEPREPGGGR